MSRGILSRTRCVMDRTRNDFSGDAWHTFALADDDTGVTVRLVDLAHKDWLDLGQPDQITVTIEPGDLLNVPGQP